MGRTFKHLSHRDREMIFKLKQEGHSLSEIGKRIGKNKSSVSRELKRNALVITPEDQVFWDSVRVLKTPRQLLKIMRKNKMDVPKTKRQWTPADAEAFSFQRASFANKKRRRKSRKTREWVISKLNQGWSPEQIAGRSALDGPEKFSHEFVYQFIQKSKKRGGKLHRLLKRFGKRKQRFSTRDYKNPIPGRVDIQERPNIVDRRERLGDLEADLIHGYKHDGYILTVVDRKSKLTALRKLQTKHKDKVRQQLEDAIKQFGKAYTITVDNGREFSDHELLRKRQNVRIYFTQPYSSTQRATVENTNGLIRYYLPKRTPFRELTQEDLEKVEKLLNNRPRKCLKFLTPKEVHAR